ncbi:hypothetical protein COV82_03080 [Candidatus Peregrinibacteria bacterium CG11_big_fil_rev_8_21_14_0_20_46_8]|nr:MAG: hypothetical protein COV82_03080 [Candidatus Peregrinibacteria bacterium CG11_big_fil_rev_8_21_14_0_20_46_8]
MKNKIALSVTVVLALVLFVPQGLAHAQDTQTFPYTKSFVISGYYSPLPNQTRYVRGSYEADIRLNGSGINSADNTPVYPGMIAAPPEFPFGTKMHIPGIGTTAVHDRGGAIKGERLDVWMGHGEEGMARALAWGKRRIEVTVYGIDDAIEVAVDIASLPLARNAGIVVGTKHFKQDLGLGSEGIEVRELQRLLQEVGNFYTGPLNGIYDEATREAVQRFQLNSGVLNSTDDSGAGHFGPRTRLAFETKIDERRAQETARVPHIIIQPGVAGDSVAQLQGVLQQYTEFDTSGLIAGAFDDVTKEALIQLQLQVGIIQTRNDAGAGYYGPQTQDALQKLVASQFAPSFTVTEEVAPHPVASGGVATTPEFIAPIATVPTPPPAPPEPPAFAQQIVLNDVGPEVRKLQEELHRLNFFGLEPTGYFGRTTEHAVFKFQQYHGLVEDKNSFGAGVVGPQTRNTLNALVAARNGKHKLIAAQQDKRQLVDARIETERELIANVVTNPNDIFNNDVTFGARGEHVEKLQQVLQRLGFFSGRVTTQYFGNSTKRALIAFQQSHGLNADGNLDFATRRKLNEIIK